MITFGREITGDLDVALRREWLVANGLGSYALGTVAGINTRRYHGLLVAALQPPLQRTLLLARLNETAYVDGAPYPLATNEYADGTVAPNGYCRLESFRLEGAIPVFTYNLAECLLEKRIWMEYGRQTTYVTYTLRRAAGPVTLELVPLVTYRDHHELRRGRDWTPEVVCRERYLKIVAGEGAVPFHLRADRGECNASGAGWHWNFLHRAETERGLDDVEDYYAAGMFIATLEPEATLTFAATLEDDVDLDGPGALARAHEREAGLVARSDLARAPEWIHQLVLAADQFIVQRKPARQPGQVTAEGMTVIAGYPWFSDWGRDTMIALPGLALKTGRPEVAAQILRTYAGCVDQGMLPNTFPDAGQAPQYNAVDATLWYFQAIDDYYTATGDRALLEDFYPILTEIIDRFEQGTRYNIRMDESDALLYAGEEGVQLTWMDAKVDGRPITPRIGKPVEINALWYNALMVLAGFGDRLGRRVGPGRYLETAARVRRSFDRYWYAEGGYLYDVLDGPHGNDATLRPNQLLALGLTHAPVGNERARAMVTVCARHLLASLGLRTLAPGDSRYAGHFGGAPHVRDAVYHQGTVWAWLIGPFVSAHFRTFGDAETARSFLLPFEHHLADGCLGTIGEVFDGDPPHTPAGCPAQAWSVAEVLRAWIEVQDA